MIWNLIKKLSFTTLCVAFLWFEYVYANKLIYE